MVFEELYQSHYEQIFKFCYRFVNDADLAGDITQDTFIKLLQRMRKSNQTIQNPKAWLYKVASNLCLNSLNTGKRRNEILEGLELKTAEQATPETLLIESELELLTRQFLDQLKPEHKLMLLLYQDGLSYKEISDATGIPLTSVGKTLWRNIDKVAIALKSIAHG